MTTTPAAMWEGGDSAPMNFWMDIQEIHRLDCGMAPILGNAINDVNKVVNEMGHEATKKPAFNEAAWHRILTYLVRNEHKVSHAENCILRKNVAPWWLSYPAPPPSR